MYCNKCGTELPSDALFCHVCGKKVDNHDVGTQNIQEKVKEIEKTGGEKQIEEQKIEEKPADSFGGTTILLFMVLPSLIYNIIKNGVNMNIWALLGGVCGTTLVVSLFCLMGRFIVRKIKGDKNEITKYVGIILGWLFSIIWYSLPSIIELL